ncbi:MAG: glycoside hydrolase family 88 protein [Bacteroidales bacterium]|nr:glycoside hydrolase family 88 protein [Bacteroidales bacterium]
MKKIIPFLLFSCAVIGCRPDIHSIIRDNVENAAVQYKMLVDSADAHGDGMIPYSFENGRIVYVDKYAWVSGFFAGSLWYLHELSKDEEWIAPARKYTEVLEDVKHYIYNHDVGFMIGDSYGNGLRLMGYPDYNEVMVTTARSLSTRFRPGAGIIQSWGIGGWTAERGWKCPVIIDNMMNLDLLFEASRISGDSTFFNIAVSHADKTMKNHFRPDGSCYHVVDYDPETGEVRSQETAQGYADESAWARGQSWAVYGFLECYENTGYKRYLEQAEKTWDFVTGHPNMPEDSVPYWDYDCPDIPDTYRDASSAAILASACYGLYDATGKSKYLRRGDLIVRSLSSPAYRAEKGTNGGFILKHSIGSMLHHGSIDTPLNYADYYLLEALARRKQLR